MMSPLTNFDMLHRLTPQLPRQSKPKGCLIKERILDVIPYLIRNPEENFLFSALRHFCTMALFHHREWRLRGYESVGCVPLLDLLTEKIILYTIPARIVL